MTHYMTHSQVWLDSSICLPWFSHVCDMTHSYVWLDTLYDAFMRVTWLIHMLATIHSHVQHYPFICAIWRIVRRIRKREYVNCDSTHPYVRHDSSTCATWLIHMCNMTHSHVQHDSFTCTTWHITWRIVWRVPASILRFELFPDQIFNSNNYIMYQKVHVRHDMQHMNVLWRTLINVIWRTFIPDL